MSQNRKIGFSSAAARVQYLLLMGLFRLAVTRGLYGRFARGLGRVFSPQNAVFVRQGDEPPFKIYLNDGYWTRFALYHTDYETEVETVLHHAAGHTDVFCDLGANKGYWSVRAAPLFSQIHAVEAAAGTFASLTENVDTLPNVTRHKRAIHAESGRKLQFLNVPLSHASARIAEANEGADETVETIAIDDLIPSGTAALIKLDVEGAEIAAFDGAGRALSDGSVFIYEDHGNDPACLPSAHVLKNPENSVYFVSNTPRKLCTVAEIRAVKTDPFKGYNFLVARAESELLRAILEGFAKPGG
ncbi:MULTISPECIES: FkbM family methyltransferase [unclassified Roseovarius]|uniref:FkbM family methyltransferase n=1 Tax=unclassified Roseovarius TaxID=2614913 RepID=UPI00273D87A5|nr:MULTISPECIES: FkbM family methyltransferase [unclassified Roseovarius]